MEHFPIVIVGGGLGGLVLAGVLHRNGIASVVYDLDASPTSRAQGGMLDMHEESGQHALREAGLFERFTAIIHAGGDAMRILDRDATVRLDEEGGGQRPEVNRRDLRRILLENLPDGAVRWGSKVTGAQALDDGRHRVTLADGGTFTTDLLVGADGAWSRIRALVTDATPAYTGISFVEVHLNDADNRHPDSAAVVGDGVMFALSDERGLIAHRDGEGRVHAYAAVKVPADWSTVGIDFTDTESAKAALLAYFDGWDPRLRAIVADADDDLVPRPLNALPAGLRWPRIPGVTLLGDAAHLMSPFAGEGANLAMLDGADLAAAIIAHPDDVEKALTRYEEAMFPRAEAAATESMANLIISFRPDAPQGLLDLMNGYRAQNPSGGGVAG